VNRRCSFLPIILCLCAVTLLTVNCGSISPTAAEREDPSAQGEEDLPPDTLVAAEEQREALRAEEAEEVEEAKEAEPEEPEETEKPPMSREQLMLEITRAAGSRFVPVRQKNGLPVMTTMDIDGNGRDDAFVLTIEQDAQDERVPIADDLKNVGRLYDKNARPVQYNLSVYLQKEDRIVSMYRIPFGRRMVLDNFRAFSLSKNAPFPYVVEASFQNLDGLAREWVIFSSYNRFSLFSLRHTVSLGASVSDIDGNGILDVIEWRRGIEEGTGHETFLTWYRWNGDHFREVGSTTIVRKLNSFIEEIERAIISDQRTKIAPYLDRKVNLDSRSALLEAIISPSEDNRSDSEHFDSPFEQCSDISSMVYRPILESPFSFEKPESRRFHLNVRLVCRNGETIFGTLEIELARNPFSEPQFRLVTRDQSRGR
jgi:hypothetical protein